MQLTSPPTCLIEVSEGLFEELFEHERHQMTLDPDDIAKTKTEPIQNVQIHIKNRNKHGHRNFSLFRLMEEPLKTLFMQIKWQE